MAVAMRYGSGEGGNRSAGVSMKLLWTNPNPTANFAAQTVSLDLSGYDAYGVVSMFSASYQYTMPLCVFPCDINHKAYVMCNARTANNTGGRLINFSTTGLAFEAASYSGSTNNSYCIPYKIYGIRGIS